MSLFTVNSWLLPLATTGCTALGLLGGVFIESRYEVLDGAWRRVEDTGDAE